RLLSGILVQGLAGLSHVMVCHLSLFLEIHALTLWHSSHKRGPRGRPPAAMSCKALHLGKIKERTGGTRENRRFFFVCFLCSLLFSFFFFFLRPPSAGPQPKTAPVFSFFPPPPLLLPP